MDKNKCPKSIYKISNLKKTVTNRYILSMRPYLLKQDIIFMKGDASPGLSCNPTS